MSLRIGVIGVGLIGKFHINRITNQLTGAEIVAVTDINKEQAKAVMEQEKINAKIYDSGEDLINSKEVDAVMVTSWGPTHEQLVLACITAGKPVFCEKPLATTVKGCRRIVEEEMAQGKPLVQVGYMRRYDKGYRALKELVKSEMIGAPLMLHCAHRIYSHPRNQGDMAITEAFVHEIDISRWLLDDDFISAQVVLPRKTRLADDSVQDPHFILLETAQGIRINTEIFINGHYGYDIQCQVVGEKGIANLPEPSNVLLHHEGRRSTGITMNWKERFTEAYETELQAWITSTKKGEMNGPSAWDGYMVAVTAEACIKAKRTGEIEPIHTPERPLFYTKLKENDAVKTI